ncbi:hypothetical protein N9W34_00360 [Rickettsiales bacterium]|nr:hypothetical protein [Rickettsiales bacterium]
MSKKNSRFDTIIKGYTQAVENFADPEELHSRLKGLLIEAVSIDMALEELLEELLEKLSSDCQGGTTKEFIDNVSLHYQRSVDSAKALDDKKIASEEIARKRKE